MVANESAQDELNKIYLPDIVGKGYASVWRSRCRYVAIKGSRRSKKSATQALKLIYQLVKYPLSNALVVRRYANTIKDSCYTQLKWAIHRLGLDGYWRFKESPLEMTYIPTGQKIFFRGLDDSLKITSITCEIGVMCWLWLEEAFEVEDEEEFDKLCDSLMGDLPGGYYRQITLTFNPWSESTWIKKRFFDSSSPDVLAVTTNYTCNEWLSEEDKAQFELMRINQPQRYRVSGLGEWGVDGAVYFEEFNPDIHVVQPFPIPEHWRIERAIDYGLDALACLYVAIDAEGNAYVVSEVYKHGLIVSDAAAAIQAGEPRQQQRWVTYAPPDLWSRTKDTGRTIDEIYRDCGVPLTKSDNNRISGWMQVHERLKPMPDVDGGQTARLKIFANCTNLIRTLSTIKADEDNINDTATEPHELTHLPDALRYWCITHARIPHEPDTRTDEQRMVDRHKAEVFGAAKRKRIRG